MVTTKYISIPHHSVQCIYEEWDIPIMFTGKVINNPLNSRHVIGKLEDNVAIFF